MRAALAKTLKATAQPALRANARAVSGLLEGYGDHVFKGATAEPYLAKQGLSAATLSNSEWTKDAAMADKVAAAVLEWATENDATTFTHAFQPQGASGVRHGLVGMVQNAFFKSITTVSRSGTSRART